MPNIVSPTSVSQEIVAICEGVLSHASVEVLAEIQIPVGDTGYAAYVKRQDLATAIIANPKPYALPFARLLALQFADINNELDNQANKFRHLVVDNPIGQNAAFLVYSFSNGWSTSGSTVDNTIFNILAGCTDADRTT